MNFLKGKKILFIAVKYFGYEKEIVRGLEKAGAQVTMFYDLPFDYAGLKYFRHLLPDSMEEKINRWYRGMLLRKASGVNWDIVFLIKGRIITTDFLSFLRRNHPDATFIQYQWDSLKNFDYKSFIPHFDYSYTFDPEDAQRLPVLKYQPTFALDEFFDLAGKRNSLKQDVDVSFVGSSHSNRLKILRRLGEKIKQHKLTSKFYCYLPVLMGLKGVLVTRRIKPGEFMFGALSREKFKALLLRSRYVLDLPSPNQSGVTLRTYEALASGCCIVTTNTKMATEPFYNESFIKIIEQEELEEKLPIVLQNKVKNTDLLQREKYSLTAWLNAIFSTVTNTKTPVRNSEINFAKV